MGIAPLSMRMAPNHMVAASARLKIAMSTGIMIANSRLTESEVCMRFRFASSKRRCSCSSLTNARMTRIPESFSRMTWFTRSTRICISPNRGSALRITSPMMIAIRGMITAIRPERGTSCLSAMITPPTAMIGAATITLSPMTTTICTCWTSFVVRVMSEGAPNEFISASEKLSTLWKSLCLTSRPNAIAVLELQ